MNRTSAILCSLAIAAIAAACTQKGGTSTGGKSDVVAVVDGVTITRKLYDEYVKIATTTPQADLSQKQRDGLLENLVRGNVLALEAQRNGVVSDDRVAATLELQRLDSLSRAMAERYLKDKTPTDAELHAEYDKQVATMDKQQYRASHILVKSEEEAKKIIAQLKSGGNFAQLAKEQSQDQGTKDKGGDLDWFSTSAMTPPFAKAVVALKKGETSQVPVQTEFGFHVIRLTDIRETAPPAFESVKDKLTQYINSSKVNAWTEELIKKANVKRSL